MKKIVIGCGSASPIDRLAPALALANSGLVQYLSFDRLAERTLAQAQVRRLENPATGQDVWMGQIVKQFAPFIKNGKRVIGNFGAANPEAAVYETIECLRKADVGRCRVGAITGDDVLKEVLAQNIELPELRCRANDIRNKIVSAHAYIGAEPIVELLSQQANFIIGGRLADPSLFVGPICYELDWPLDDWNRVGTATVVGHLLECGTYITGANFSDPPYRMVPALHDLALPMAVVNAEEIIITKLPGTGGMINDMTVKTQLGYEIHDPRRYLTPDVTADFSGVTVENLGNDRVRISGARGTERPANYKVLVGIDNGWKSVTEGSFGGPGCVTRAKVAEEMIRKLIEPFGSDVEDIRFDLHGATALFGNQLTMGTPADVRLRFAARCKSRAVAEAVGYEAEFSVYFGPAGGGGVDRQISRLIGVTPAFLPRASVPVKTEIVTV